MRHAQQSAASSKNELVYDLLTELLVCYIQKGEDQKIYAGVYQTIKIAGRIDRNALCALTAVHAFERFTPEPGTCMDGLRRLNETFNKIMCCDLPSGFEWIEHLEVLGAIRLWPRNYKMESVLSHYIPQMDGYLCVGIKKGSNEYDKAMLLLDSVGIGYMGLIPNECLDGYVRLPIANKYSIDKLYFDDENHTSLNASQKQILRQIWGMYSQNPVLKEQVATKFMKIFDSFEALHAFRLWWEKIPQPFNITQVGRILAHTNAQHCDKDIPDLL